MESIDPRILDEFKLKETPSAGRGPLEHVFHGAFTFREIITSRVLPTGKLQYNTIAS